MNRDRVGEFYRGTAASTRHQQLTRERIHWMCRNVVGTDVLDIGCSQGIASILLGREGLNVVGIDHEMEAIEDARKALAQEDPLVQKKVRFEYVEATELPFPDDAFDTVLLGEIIEHLVLPRRVLDEVSRVLRPDGAVIITTPYGLHEFHDHKDSIYLSTLEEMLAPHFVIDHLELLGPYIAAIVRAGSRATDMDTRLLAAAEQRVRDLDADLSEERRRFQDAKGKLATFKEDARARIDGLKQNVTDERKRAARATRELAKVHSSRRWRVASAFTEALRSPKGLLRLPVALVRALRRGTPAL